jgi:hypothetical protein
MVVIPVSCRIFFYFTRPISTIYKNINEYIMFTVGFLNAYFPDWYTMSPESRLSFGFNAQRTLFWFTHEKCPGYWNSIQPLKIVHYSSSPKPWEVEMSQVKIGTMILLVDGG